ncbi:outer membrane beta-barrel protein [Sphingobacterium sp. WQ 366]|uniref:Outer membrane beta-barrel protein n=1 Tax=Sphingobacterium bovistauri TaxID=2781959 RepID=A0ABS7Z8L9_9SPHI|nr:outer membrane beta-barrel protein [Sphingobacterium bovistauri]
MTTVHAQRYQIGVNGATTGYMGDLNSENPFYLKNFGGGIFVKYNLDPTWGVKLSANHLLISGDDLDFKNTLHQVRNLKFNNQLTEIAVALDFNFWTYFNSKHRSKFTPYLSTGLALLKHDPYVYYEHNKIKLRPLQLEYDALTDTELYKNWNLAIPLAIGIKYKLNSSWDLGIEANYRIAFTDYLDNVSKYYATSTPDMVDLPKVTVGPVDSPRPFDLNDWKHLADPSNNLTSNAGRSRGDGRNMDGYMTVGITLTYTIFDPNCYSWIKR